MADRTHARARLWASKATDAARQMRAVDPTIKLIACGSSGPFMPTYIDWDRTVLEECYDAVDGISLHHYWGNAEETHQRQPNVSGYEPGDGPADPRRSPQCAIRFARRSVPANSYGCPSTNGTYGIARGAGISVAWESIVFSHPHLLEEPYNLEDALLVGGLANSLIRNSDRVKVACLAQLVNVIAPIATNESGLLRHTIYYPYAWALKYARGNALSVQFEGPG